MSYRILVAPEALDDLASLPATVRAGVRDAIGLHLRHEPAKVSKSRIKRLRGLARPQYRLRVGEVRVFSDIVDREVQILAVVQKPRAADWLAQFGEAE